MIVRQSKFMSFVESWANIFIGYTINIFGNALFWPLFGYHIKLTDNLLVGVLFTFVSLARSYTIRRYFNRMVKP